MARVRNVVLLFATLCCYASISSGDENQVVDNEDVDHEQLVDFVARIARQVYEDQIGMSDNNEELVKSLSKRQASQPGNGLPMNVPVKMSGFAFGKRDGQLVRRSAQAKPVKLAGFAFGKRGQLVKRSSDDQLMEEDDTEKRGALDAAFTFGKRRDPSALSAFSFGKRRDPMGLSALTFGKRGMNPASGYSAFTFGKRGQMDNLHAFSFGKRGMDPSGLSAFSFGKRGRDPSALSAFSFGKRMGMNAFTFGKREGSEEEGAFEEENDDVKRNQLSSLTGYTFGKRDTQAAAEDNTLNQEETLRTN